MFDLKAPVATAQEPILHPFEFRGTGREFFRIWIVNVALTLITLGIYSAWAKVRTRRYFYGNTFVDGHSFDYHASPKRILIGRLIAIALLVAYNLIGRLSPLASIPALILFAAAIPWLIVSAARFNARNTSYRNVRFNFDGTYGGAFGVYIFQTFIAFLTLGIAWPMVHREREYFYINHHTFGGRRFATSFSGRSIYAIYLEALLILIAFGLAVGILSVVGPTLEVMKNLATAATRVTALSTIIGLMFALAFIVASAIVRTEVFNLAVGNTVVDERHRFRAKLSPWVMLWIGLTNLILILVTIGLFYPWARVRMARYKAENVDLIATSNLDEFTSEIFATQGAIGEEIAGFFDYDIGL